jgi:lysophospholipase L1-like esterase
MAGAGFAAALPLALLPIVSAHSAIAAASKPAPCRANSWVASWTASPTDSFPTVDPTLQPSPSTLTDQTVRMVITPHLGGTMVRLHLSNRFAHRSLAIGHVTIGRQGAGAATGAPVEVTFSHRESVTVPAERDIVSDPVAMNITANFPLVVSIYLPDASSPVTEHWNANATSFYTDRGSGDQTSQTSGAAFAHRTYSWFYVAGLDVQAPARSLVAFGDSITDGFVGGSPLSLPVSLSVNDKNERYPDFLQRRITAAGMRLSVANAGIGSNQLLSSLGLMTGPSGLSRFDADALQVSGAAGVLLLEGINDLGLGHARAAAIIAGYRQLIARTHAAGKKIWLATITPAANAVIDGVLLAPRSEIDRRAVNAWIRSQRLTDGVVDFDAALRDPASPSQLLPAYSGPDHLHPNAAGYERMAATVPLTALAAIACR